MPSCDTGAVLFDSLRFYRGRFAVNAGLCSNNFCDEEKMCCNIFCDFAELCCNSLCEKGEMFYNMVAEKSEMLRKFVEKRCETLCENLWEMWEKCCGKVRSCSVFVNCGGKVGVFHSSVYKFCKRFAHWDYRDDGVDLHSFHIAYYYYFYLLR